LAEITRDFAATTFVVQDGKTLLLWHEKLKAWLPPGGHMEPHELPELAAVREVREETGLDVRLLGDRHTIGEVPVLIEPVCTLLETIEPGHQHIDFIYFAAVVGGKLRLNPRESSRCVWCDLNDLATLEVAEDVRQLAVRALESHAPTARKR
jgi:ADP-ribose pyrophosphatase YjhB (NUDIX family)